MQGPRPRLKEFSKPKNAKLTLKRIIQYIFIDHKWSFLFVILCIITASLSRDIIDCP